MAASSACSWARSPPCALLLLLITSSAVGMVRSDIAKDKAECATTLLGMATCLTYVQGEAKAPTPDCCSGLSGVYTANRKCLCLLIKDRDDPDLGVTFNASMALSLPTACHNSAVNITECPMLLNLPPGSKDAEIFLQSGKDQGSSKTAGGAGAKSSVATSTPASKSADTSGVGGKKKTTTTRTMMMLGMDMASGASTSLILLVAFILVLDG